MADHTHPEYEENFSRILTIIEKLADNVEHLAEGMVRMTDEMGRVTGGMVRVTEAMERLTIKSGETEDKLNALIDLVDRHIREHRGEPQP